MTGHGPTTAQRQIDPVVEVTVSNSTVPVEDREFLVPSGVQTAFKTCDLEGSYF